METKCSDLAKNYTGTLTSFYPFPSCTGKEFFQNLPSSVQGRLRAEGEKYLNFSYPYIQATDYMKFKKVGNRTDFEDIYFSKRHALNALTLAECLEQNGRFLDDIINGIFSICEESGWQLPAHNSYIRDTEADLLPDATRPILDLFACETGALLAMVHYLLADKLNLISPYIVRRIESELLNRIITPYLTTHFWWMGNGNEPMCNWTVWCTQNILLTTFLVFQKPETLSSVFQKASLSCDYFLKDYGIDGCCDEGAQYYRHAGLCLYNALTILNTVSNGAFQSLFSDPKIKNIASYILNVHVEDAYYINFADCSPIAGRCGVREYLFGKATSNPELMQFAAEDFRASDGTLYSDEVNQLNLFYRIQTLSYYREVMNYDSHLPVISPDIYYPSVGLFITRNETFCLAAKAGDNADSHNHNDTGSFTIYKNGKPLFIDIGVESYTKKTFSPNRYEIWTMQSGYHNLPTILGLDEKDGADFHASQVHVLNSGITMDLATAYPLSDTTIYYKRQITLDKVNNYITLADHTNAEDIILNFITYEKPFIENNCLHIGELASARFEHASAKAVEVLPITDARLKLAWKHDLYRVRLQLESSDFSMMIQ